jgi:hypothetical protein
MGTDVLRAIGHQGERIAQVSHALGFALHGINVPPTGVGIPCGIPALYIRSFLGCPRDVWMCCLWLHEVGFSQYPAPPTGLLQRFLELRNYWTFLPVISCRTNLMAC